VLSLRWADAITANNATGALSRCRRRRRGRRRRRRRRRRRQRRINNRWATKDAWRPHQLVVLPDVARSRRL
jgi:hypothetical protein